MQKNEKSNNLVKYFIIILFYVFYIGLIYLGKKYNFISESIFDNLISGIIEISFIGGVVGLYIKYYNYSNNQKSNKFFTSKFIDDIYFEREIPIIELLHNYIYENKEDFKISNELLKGINNNKKGNGLNHIVVYETYKFIRGYFYSNAKGMYEKLIPIILDNKSSLLYLVKQDLYYINEIINNSTNNHFYSKIINSYHLLIDSFNIDFKRGKERKPHYIGFYILINNWLQIRELIYSNFEDKNIKDDFRKFIKDIEEKENKDNFFDRDDFIYLK